MNEPIDLSAFPILRIDQISFVDSNDLENSLKEVKVLLQAGENDNPAMYRYLVKQYDLMKREMESRRALSRVENLLRGLEDPLNRKIDSSTIISPRIPDNIHDVPKATKQEESQHISNKTAESIVINAVTKKSGVDTNLMMDNDGAKLDVETRHETPTKVQPAIESITLPLQRDGLPSATKIHSGVEHLTPRSTHSSHSNRSSRRSQHNDPDNNPSKKSIEVVYKNFGNEFIVAATEKKKRFYPAKKPTETIEEIKNRERNERRKQAMQRLLQRKEQRELQMQKMREKKRIERIEQQKKKEAEEKERRKLSEMQLNDENVVDSAQAMDSSDSESVSGGDDDDTDRANQLQITENMVEAAKNILSEKEVIMDVQNYSEAEERDKLLEGSDQIDGDFNSKHHTNAAALNVAFHKEESKRQSNNQRKVTTRKVQNNNGQEKVVSSTRKGPTLQSSSSSAKVSRRKPIVSDDMVTKRRNTIPPGEETSVEKLNSTTSDVPCEEKAQIEEDKLEDLPMETELAAKNLAALSTIRRLKQMKQLDRSKSSSEIIEKVLPELEAQSPDVSSTTEIQEIEHTTSPSRTDNLVGIEYEEKASNETKNEFEAKESNDLIPQEACIEDENYVIADSSRQNPHQDEVKAFLPLFEKQDGYYCCNYDPEQLPGLLAWKLEPISRGKYDWKIHLSHYHPISSPHYPPLPPQNEIFEYRAAKRRQIPYGLIQLAQDCQEILLGLQPVEENENFLAYWMDRIAIFDERAAVMNEEQERALFSKCWVCGNGFMVCKKLEDLIKDVFSQYRPSSPSIVSSSSAESIGETEKEKSSRPTTVARDSIASRLQTRSSTLPDNDHTDSLLVLPPLPDRSLLQGDQTISSEVDDHDNDDENDGREEEDADVENNADKEEHIAKKEVINEDTVEEIIRIDQNDESKEKSIVNSSTIAERKSLEKEKQKIRNSGNPLRQSTDRKQAGKIPRSISNKPSQTAITTTTTPNNENTFRLIDYYPNFAMIFPVAYHQLGSARDTDLTSASSTSSSAARILIETMHIQAKLYQEWLEIMRDYSTVFCSEDNPSIMNPLGMERSAAVYEGKSNTLHYRVKSSRSEVSNIITDVFTRESLSPLWIPLPSGLGLGLTWNLLWTWSKPRINKEHLVIWQKVNHFEDSKQLTRKDLLKKNLQRFTSEGIKDHILQQRYGQEFEIMPQTFLLPQEYIQFVSSYKEFEALKTTITTTMTSEETTSTSDKNMTSTPPFHNYWILKPIGLSRGRGISLIQHLSEVVYSQASVIQKYIERPLCLQQYKFDLRLFIVVTSFKPLEAFIYRDGFARVSTHAYSLDTNALQNKFIHLTNSSIQKQNQQGPTADNPLKNQENDPDTGGSKIALLGPNGLWKRLEQLSQGTIQIDVIWQRICLLVVKSLVVVDDKMIYQPNSFELFGYDILIDQDLRPWLLEVNASPSLARDNALDTRIKNVMIKDLIQLLDVAPYDRAALSRVITKRLQQMTTKPARSMKMNVRNDVELEKDLREILGEYRPRRYGELPQRMGNYERLAPDTNYYQQVMKIKKKLFRSANNPEE